MYDERSLWLFLPIGYLLTVAIELPILWLLLSQVLGSGNRRESQNVSHRKNRYSGH